MSDVAPTYLLLFLNPSILFVLVSFVYRLEPWKDSPIDASTWSFNEPLPYAQLSSLPWLVAASSYLDRKPKVTSSSI